MKRIDYGISAGKVIALDRIFRLRALLLLMICSLLGFFVTGAWGTIPATERTVLVNIYNATEGPGWKNNTNWNGAAYTECTWWGVGCDAGANHVIGINLSHNNLNGGPLPDLSGLTNLQSFDVDSNQLLGSIPSLSGLTNLQYFDVSMNINLTGPIPSLSNLTNLQHFDVSINDNLTGPIPSISNLTNLQYFSLNQNHLTGSIPSLDGLTNLQHFDIGFNQLTGSIPSLDGLSNLQHFNIGYNQLSGSIPSLSGLANLGYFDVAGNYLTGSIPSLSGLTNLGYFDVSGNQLSGSIPSLSSLTNLGTFDVTGNQLTGSIPSLSSFTNLYTFAVGFNYLMGDVPSVPSPNKLGCFSVGKSLICFTHLCPNYLNHTSDPAWDAATGTTPWYQSCPAAPPTQSVTYNGNGNTGSAVPFDGSAYFPGMTVTVLGNTGALYKTGNSFVGWNTAADGSAMSYVGGDTFVMGAANMMLYAQWTTSSGSPVRIAETLAGYPDIQSAYNAAQDGQTIEAQDGLGSQNPLLFDNPHNYNPFSVKLSGGYNATVPSFTTDTGATLIIGSIEISSGSITIDKIIIH